jgi:hypothetical protein
MDDTVDIARLNRVKMGHQPHIIRIILPHMSEVITERLPLGEMLPVIGKTAIQRVPPRVDDFRIGQDQADERHIIPIVGQLVDEERLIGFALDAGAFDKFSTQPLGVLRAKSNRNGARFTIELPLADPAAT